MSDLSDDLRALKIDRAAPSKDPSAPSRWRWPLMLALAGGAVAAAYVWGVPYVKQRVQSTPVNVAEIALTSPATASASFSATGYVESQTSSKVGPKTAGRVAKVMVVQGQTVEAGTVLYQLDVATEKATIAQAAARARAAKAQADTARANLAEIELQAKRAEDLAAQGVRPGAQADDLKARGSALRKAVQAADAQAAASQAEVAALGVNLDALTVTTPIKGVVVSKPPTAGENVAPGSPAGEIEIVDFTQLVAVVDVPEMRVGNVKLEAPGEVVLDAFVGKRFRGKAVEIVPKVDRAKTTVPVKVAFLDDTAGILPGMSARVSFLDKPLDENAVKAPARPVVPSAAIVEEGSNAFVFVVENGKVHKTAIALGEPLAGGRVVVNGPATGTKVVLNPGKLRDGQSVKEENGQ